MEGLFVQQMFAAMRETVPDDGIVQESNAQGIFTDMLDQHVAEESPKHLQGQHSLAEALYQQLRQKEGPAASTSPSTATRRVGP